MSQPLRYSINNNKLIYCFYITIYIYFSMVSVLDIQQINNPKISPNIIINGNLTKNKELFVEIK